ncbi:hypothetical protein [Novosphingobium sp. P6W]|uniref:thiosulfate dehydrogenase n=1 Tax=Novosphingobium sp. P6W TaxID=1609758 RepID=UPI0005C31CF6|nr:hypothetical protein [Novosphingobium sp. P6W]AXB80390.1 transcriptional initiation protein Tat [Novosphingobium sp. P6W]KIS31328.1 hypothetical protein TQ38_17730 [Novosphingobium sp. P6W]
MHDVSISRRRTFGVLGGAALLASVPQTVLAGSKASKVDGLAPGAAILSELSKRLADAPRRRSFAKVPFMIDRSELWDHEASALVLGYRGTRTQVWESTDIAAPWLNLMREAMNGQAFAHGHADFLAVAAVHGTAHLALFGQEMWTKYDLAANIGGKPAENVFLRETSGVSPSDDRQKTGGFYGPGNNNIASLQRRGAVMVACHDSIHAIARGLVAKQGGGDADVIAADLTNNLIPGAVLVPSVVAYLIELQHVGFTYAKGS